MSLILSQLFSTIAGSSPEKKSLTEFEPRGLDEIDLIKERIIFNNCSAYHTLKISDFKDKFPELKSHTLKQYDLDKNLVCNLGFHISPPPNEAMRALNGAAWGANFIENLSERIPHISAQAFPSDQGDYRIRDLNFHAYNYILYVPFESKKWEHEWDPIQENLIGRGKLDARQKKYWVYAHEMDHMQGYFSYWRFMLKQIVTALNTPFDSPEKASEAILELQYNNILNFPIGVSRSSAFDEYTRGIPQCGSRFSVTKWKSDENFVWHPWKNFPEGLKSQCFRDPIKPRLGTYAALKISEIKSRLRIEDKVDQMIKNGETKELLSTLQKYTNAYNSK